MKKLTALITVLTIFCQGCSDSTFQDTPTAPEQKEHDIDIEITVSAPSMSGTRSLTLAEEQKIESLSVLLFEPNEANRTIPSKFYGCITASQSGSDSGTVKTYQAKLKFTDKKPDSLIAVLMANAEENISGITESLSKMQGESYETLQTLFCMDSKREVSPISMWGVCTPAIDTNLSTNLIRASLLRSCARIDVDASALSADKFQLEEIKMARVSLRSCLLPSPLNLGTSPFDGSTAVKVPTIPADNTLSDNPWNEAGSNTWHFKGPASDNCILAEMYTPECDVIMGGDRDPYDDNRLNRTALIIGGKYSGSPITTYYRVDIAVEGKLVDILRNHRYNIHIKDVMGPGQETPREAYENISATISADVIEWTNADTEIVFDGAHWFSVGSKYVSIGGSAGSQKMLHVDSDIPATEWQARWETYEGEKLTDYGSLSCSLFNASLPQTTNSYIIFDARTSMTVTDGLRVCILRVSVSPRLEIPITVQQFPTYGEPWENGGEIPVTYE